MKSSSRYSLAHILSTSSSKSRLRLCQFFEIYLINYLMTMWLTCEIKLSLQSRALFVHLIFQTVVRTRQYFAIFMWNRALAAVSCTFCPPHLPNSGSDPSVFCNFYVESSSRCSLVHILSTIFPDRGAQRRKQRPSSGDHGLYPKKDEKHKVLRPRVIHAFPIPHTSQLLHDDVVNMMMMWLT